MNGPVVDIIGEFQKLNRNGVICDERIFMKNFEAKYLKQYLRGGSLASASNTLIGVECG